MIRAAAKSVIVEERESRPCNRKWHGSIHQLILLCMEGKRAVGQLNGSQEVVFFLLVDVQVLPILKLEAARKDCPVSHLSNLSLLQWFSLSY